MALVTKVGVAPAKPSSNVAAKLALPGNELARVFFALLGSSRWGTALTTDKVLGVKVLACTLLCVAVALTSKVRALTLS